MLARLRIAFSWARARFASVVFATIGICAAALAMRQSYHFGHSLGVTEVGKESYAQWLTLIDIATAVLPIAAVIMWRRGSTRTSLALGLATILFVAFSISNQIGFGAAERLGQSARIAAINKAAADAHAEQQRLIQSQIKWNNNSVVNRGASRSSRKENIASTERLIAATGSIDPDKVYAAPTDLQATSLVSLTKRWTNWDIDAEGMALFLVVGVAILGILIKPIFLGLAAYFYPGETKHEAEAKKDKGKDDRPGDDDGLPLAAHVGAYAKEEARAGEPSATLHAETVEVAQEVATAAGGIEPVGLSAPSNDAPREEPVPEVKAEAPVTSVPSIREYLVADKATRMVPFKAKDTRKHARLTDGHVENFVSTLVGYAADGELLPFKSSVWEKYKLFCAEQNLRPMHDKALSNALGRFGIARHRPTGGSVYLKMPVDLAAKIAASREFFASEGEMATAH